MSIFQYISKVPLTLAPLLREETCHHMVLASCESRKNDISSFICKNMIAPHNILLWLAISTATYLKFILCTPWLILKNNKGRVKISKAGDILGI